MGARRGPPKVKYSNAYSPRQKRGHLHARVSLLRDPANCLSTKETRFKSSHPRASRYRAPPFDLYFSLMLTEGAGLAVDSQRETVYIAEVAMTGSRASFRNQPAAPLVEAGSEAVSDASADSATLEAAVNPRSEHGEEPTSYRFQYTTEEEFQRKGFAGASSIPVPDWAAGAEL